MLASGCGSASNLGNVLIDIVAYRPTKSDTQAELTLRFANENVFPLAISDISGKLYLNGTYVGKIENKNPIGIPQLSSLNRNVLLLIENPAFMQQLRGGTAAISYRFESLLRLDVSEERMKIRGVSNGQIDSASLRTEPATESKPSVR